MKKTIMIIGFILFCTGLKTYAQSDSIVGYIRAASLNLITEKLEMIELLKDNQNINIYDLAKDNLLTIGKGGSPLYEEPNIPPEDRIIIPQGSKIKVISLKPTYTVIPSDNNYQCIWIEIIFKK